MSDLLLVIANKKYSSWSLRAWIGLKQLGLAFAEHRIGLSQPDTGQRIAQYSPTGRVPVLVDGGLKVHESIAILEYANETYGEGRLLPKERAKRALCRSVSAEMHSSFPALRQTLPMNLARKSAPVPLTDAVRADIRRILGMWEDLRAQHRDAGPFLFGPFTLADCMYLPVATRFMTYEVDLTSAPRARAYAAAVQALPAFQEWKQAGIQETEVVPEDEV
jgi:glutathione S-transferase